MDKFSFDSKCIYRNGKPWFPVMGEIHYSRCDRRFWKESLLKMKAGGVDVASSYVIWIHHEEAEGEYDFSGSRDLRAFLRCVGECGLDMMLRIGPWVHGEVRNGGFPDWLYQKGFEPRTNDERYFAQVRRFYERIFREAEGLLHKDGGPVIGIQIENEFGHCGGLTGSEGDRHMRTLTEIARETGFDVPLYTATGWGGAMTGGLLPVMGCYCEAPWDPGTHELEPNVNYVFTHERNDKNIGTDFGIGAGLTFDPMRFPYLMAELGGGLQVTQHRRPVATGQDIGAMSLVKLGSGCNLLGYYMYHGGTNPKGRLASLQETMETGSVSELPEFTYDFEAPIREYGQISDTYKEVKLLAMFLKDFGSDLCHMDAFIPGPNPQDAGDFTHLRYAIRSAGERGYLFVNNYQRHYPMAAHPGAEFCADGVAFPPMDITDGDYFFCPFNMPIGNALLKTACATPLCVLNSTDYVFYTDGDPKYEVAGDMSGMRLITLTRQQAKNAYKVMLDKEYLLICDAAVIQPEDGIEAFCGEELRVMIYPYLAIRGFEPRGSEGDFSVWDKTVSQERSSASFERVAEDAESTEYEIYVEVAPGANDCFLTIHYEGERARLYIDGMQAGDNFYTGQGWTIGLKRFDFPQKLRVRIFALHETDDVYLETWPEMESGQACRMRRIDVRTEYKVKLEASR